jgi:ubiquinone/menaquinone biosynthesis C-methylase UbiE
MSERCLTALQKLDQCQSLDDLVSAFGCDTASPFDSPVVPRLYDALMVYERAPMLAGVVDDFVALMDTPVSGARFLDVGCGTGRVILEIARHFPGLRASYIGIDPSAEMVAIANENLERCGVRGDFRFLQGTASDPVIAEQVGNVDFVVIRNTVSWMSHPESELKKCAQFLSPGGKLLVRELRRDASFSLLKRRIAGCLAFPAGNLVLSYPPSAMIAAYKSALTTPELCSYLVAAGLVITSTRPVETDDTLSEPWGVDMLLAAEAAQ